MVTYIDDPRSQIDNKRVLVRADYNISLNKDHSIGNDTRIKQSLPTLTYLMEHGCKIILLSHLGEPTGFDIALSLSPIRDDLAKLLPTSTVTLFPTIQALTEALPRQQSSDIFLLENIRFLSGEQANDPQFSQTLSSLADVYVNDAFSVSHRKAASVVGIPSLLPSFGGLLLKKEITTLEPLLSNPLHPFVVILGGAKISTKLPLLTKLSAHADTVIAGGGIANTLLVAQGTPLGKSLVEEDMLDLAKEYLTHLDTNHTTLLLPSDVVVGDTIDATTSTIKSTSEIGTTDMVLDIGPNTIQTYTKSLSLAKTILWNGPLGYFENPLFRKGTDATYEAIATNNQAISIVGGGETIAALANESHPERITHISTGGGAMLEYLEKGTLPGIAALSR